MTSAENQKVFADTAFHIPSNTTIAIDDPISEQFAAAVRLKPDDPVYLGNLGSALAAAGGLEEAATAYNRSLALRPDSAAVHAGLALVLRALGRNGEAVTHARDALRIDPGLAAARALLRETALAPREIVQKALTIAGEICIFSNTNITIVEPERR